MASIGDVTRPAFAYDEATDTWVPVGIGPHSHTAANVGAVATSSFAAKGDLLVGTGAGTLTAQTVGANGTVLTADSAEADGVKWAVPGGATLNTSLITSGTITSGTSLTLSSLTSYDQLFLSLTGLTTGTAGSTLSMAINGVSTGVYTQMRVENRLGGTNAGTGNTSVGNTIFNYGANYGWKNNNQNGILFAFTNCKSASGFTNIAVEGTWEHFNTTDRIIYTGQDAFTSNATVSSITLSWGDGYSFTGGTYRLYGAA
jgi:hypothetical protein